MTELEDYVQQLEEIEICRSPLVLENSRIFVSFIINKLRTMYFEEHIQMTIDFNPSSRCQEKYYYRYSSHPAELFAVNGNNRSKTDVYCDPGCFY
ncbi:hypothetical protein [Chamaesiphon polymorphus]|uniref:hypothetical protein n=1 Tax=Chamaesiphon polymorphus TaxID=2107691 RepID=UPI0011B22B6A|nr:hypothetical protein [Chamaesiphon polymorphus]